MKYEVENTVLKLLIFLLMITIDIMGFALVVFKNHDFVGFFIYKKLNNSNRP